ncbi:hypothetical protein GH714_009946 [Hevea brasiliensis]|uniref:RING-type E3 ubiquitin transferase n=1 Tax=Hevea brasiliensis TaxID=3981 RepID=A0A6A6KMW5_HEVBR|nr:hypothetical protein GH714_009946 [Hevea brasiliensis]
METSLVCKHRLFLEKEMGMPPYHGNRESSENATDFTNFDGNMVIVLAVLLCALVCALGINSIVRCALRCGCRFISENSSVQAGSRPAEAAAGLKKSTLSQISVVRYETGLNIPVTDCPICLGEFAEGEKVRVLPKCNDDEQLRMLRLQLPENGTR